MSGFDGVEGSEGSCRLELEGVGGGDAKGPLQAAHSQGTLSISRGQLQPALLARPNKRGNNRIFS